MAKFKPLSFDEVLPRLVASYRKGKLVPFTGSGISAPSIPTWEGFIKKLAPTIDQEKKYTSAQLISISEEVITDLQRKGGEQFIKAIKESLGIAERTPPIPRQCKVLSKLWWPLVMSTNYDSLFVESYRAEHRDIDGPPISVYGRNPLDCHTLLSALNSPVNTSYWALQGYLGDSDDTKKDDIKKLEREVVVGYRQYRNVTYNNHIFRAAFSEVFRSHSLFFLGSGLSEDYFMGLFGETIEKLGSNPHSHCVLFPEKELKEGIVDPHFLHTKFNIIAAFYKDRYEEYDGLYYCLEEFRSAVNSPSFKCYAIEFDTKNFKELDHYHAPKLEIIAGTLPPPADGEGSVLSVGISDDGPVGITAKTFVVRHFGADAWHQGIRHIDNTLVWQKEGTGVLLAAARNTEVKISRDARDLRLVSQAVYDILKVTSNNKYKVIHTMLLAAGRKRTFHPIFAFVQMIRGYKKAVMEFNSCPPLKIYTIDPAVIFYFRRNPLEIEELLNCNDMRIVVEIYDTSEIDRSQIFLEPTKTLGEVSAYYQIEPDYWTVKIIPNPFPTLQAKTNDTTTLEDLGLIPGSTIRYMRKSL